MIGRRVIVLAQSAGLAVGSFMLLIMSGTVVSPAAAEAAEQGPYFSREECEEVRASDPNANPALRCHFRLQQGAWYYYVLD